MAHRSLQEFVTEANGESHLRVEHDFGDGFVRLHTSEAERRQAAQDIRCSENIVLELLRNSRDAHAAHIFLAVSKKGDKRSITVIDDGVGIPQSMHEHVFEPRVTSKLDSSHMDAWGLHGRGMALYSIAANALVAQVADSDVKLGCSIVVETDTRHLPEKTDQSGFPRFELSDSGSVNVRGPRNIVRTSCEFAIDSSDSCSVYLGSPAEIAATLYAYGTSTLSAIDRAFCNDVKDLPLVKRLATAADPEDFTEQARTIGLDMSSRTARRIMDGQIEDVVPLLDLIVVEKPKNPKKKQARMRASGQKVKLGKEDIELLAHATQDAFSEIAERYYLDGNVSPRVKTTRDRLIVTIPLIEKD